VDAAEVNLEELSQLESASKEPFLHRHQRLIVLAMAAASTIARLAVTLAALLAIQYLPVPARAVVSAAGALGLAVDGARKGSLDSSGAAAALLVGGLSLFASARAAWSLIGFYLSASALTKMAQTFKQDVGDEYVAGGGRSWVQVFCNSAVPTALAVAAWALGAGEVPLGSGTGGLTPAVSTALWGGVLGYYACCCGDTWASEVGVLSTAEPRLITTLRPVRRGTNGGVTALGLAMSALGGLFVGGLFAAASYLAPGASRPAVAAQALGVAGVGLASGLAGSLVDSALGATVQFSGYDVRRRKVTSRPGDHVVRISGSHLLDNNAVNLVSASATAALSAAACVRLFC